MKWIKAKEKLPNVRYGVYVVKNEHGEVSQMGYNLSSPQRWHYLRGLKMTENCVLQKSSITEWLDESESIPSVTNEEDEEIKRWQEAHKNVTEYYNKLVESLQSQLSQLQSKMEEEKRKAFEAAREWNDNVSLDLPGAVKAAAFVLASLKYKKPEDYLKSTTQSTESGNLNTK
jgi:hypothetical protein